MVPIPGQQFGPYTIVAPLGHGGMGEVFLARDTRLDREVAVKIVRAERGDDPEARGRFEREARLLGQLNHPNIAIVYGLEEADGVRLLVMELVPGQTLAAHLRDGPLPVGRALAVCRQIALGLEAAHGRGIIHRDLKPANVMVTPAGTVKLLDFGLAKELTAALNSEASTLEAPLTRSGVVIGTPSYMSPEQARGQPLDPATDLWSLGCVLYETLTGRRPFTGDSVPDILVAILERQPDCRVLPPQTPPRIRRLLVDCLAKEPRQRLADAGRAARELEMATAELNRAASDASPPVVVPLAAPAPTVLPVAARTERLVPMTTGKVDKPARPRRHVWRWALGCGLVFFLCCGGGGYFAGTTVWRGLAGWWEQSPFSMAGPKNSVAVLPFDTDDRDPFSKEGEPLAAAINKYLTNTAPELRVTPHVSAAKHRSDNPMFAAQFLHVRWVVAGKIVRRDKTLILRAELVDARTQAVVWTHEYPAASVEDDAVAQDIAAKVRAETQKRK